MNEQERMMEAMMRIQSSVKNAERILEAVLPTMLEVEDTHMLFSILGVIVDAYADTHDVPENEVEEMYNAVLTARKEIYAMLKEEEA